MSGEVEDEDMIANNFTHWVAVQVDTRCQWGRDVVAGVLEFAKQSGEWRVFVEGLTPPSSRHSVDKCDALITDRLPSPRDQPDQPVIRVARQRSNQVAADVSLNIENLISLSIDHFANRGFSKVTQLGIENGDFHDHAMQAFAARAASRLDYVDPLLLAPTSSREELLEWIDRLPSPVAVLSWHPQIAVELANTCRAAGIVVPNQVAILSAEEDLFCTGSFPEISSVELPGRHAGFQAARLLRSQLRGESDSPEPISVGNFRINMRRSTNALAVGDDDLRLALEYIDLNAHNGIQVDDVVHAVCISRRSLERRFRKFLGYTMGDEIIRVRVERAAELLQTTDLPIPKVADESGFSSPEYFATVFRSHHGTSPLKYRDSWRNRLE